jgi:hypothetical protein
MEKRQHRKWFVHRGGQFSNEEPFMSRIEIWDIRLWRSTAAIRKVLDAFLIHPVLTKYGDRQGGQIYSDVVVGVELEQKTCRFRRRGDLKMIYLHLRQTCQRCPSPCDRLIATMVRYPLDQMMLVNRPPSHWSLRKGELYVFQTYF